MDITALLILVILISFFAAILLALGVRIIHPWEAGLHVRLGTFKRSLRPGFHWVMPFVSKIIKVDLREQAIDVPRQEVITKDNSPTNVDAVIYLKVVDPEKAIFNINNFTMATVYLAQTTLRSTIGDMELDEILYNREKINIALRDKLDEATDPWGVKVTKVEIREVDPVGRVKQSMEEQTAAERERRAAILRADGEKRAAILVAEGEKRAMILRAEGDRQSKILRAEGERLARILTAQGEAQKLRILSLGAAAIDQKALSVLSLDTLAKVADGQATKIIFPFEISRMLEGVSEYLGAGKKIPDRPLHEIRELEREIGLADEILGGIPKPGEIKAQLQAIEGELEKEAAQTDRIVHLKAPPLSDEEDETG